MTLRLAMVSSYPAPGERAAGGVEVSTERLVRALAAAGVEVTVVAPGAASDAHDGTARVIHVTADERRSLLRGLRPWRRAAGEVIRRLEPDVVHGQGLLAAGLAATDQRGRPRVVTAHGNLAEDTRAGRAPGPGRAVRIALVERLTRGVVARADAVLSVHPDPAYNLPAVPKRFLYVPSIVDAVFERPAVAQPVPGRVLYCGGSRLIKGWDLLAAAWPTVLARAPQAELEVVGWPDEPLPDALAAARVTGRLAPAELREALGTATLLVIPSRFEVAPVALLEAWAAGTPVVATRVGGVPALAEGAAVLASPEAASIAAAVARVLTGEQPTAELVAEGRRRAASATAERVAAAHLALYEELLG